jgi:hypothetical protein
MRKERVQPNSKNSYSLGISLSENAYDALDSGFHQELIKMVRQLNDSPNHPPSQFHFAKTLIAQYYTGGITW